MDWVIEHLPDILLNPLSAIHFIALFVVLLFLLWYYLGIGKSNKQIIKKRVKYSLYILLIVESIIWGLFCINEICESTFSNNETGILVLFPVADSEILSSSLQRDIINSLNNEINSFGDSTEIVVRASKELVSEDYGNEIAHNRAREIGRKQNAKVVVWGSRIGANKFHPRITIVNKNEFPFKTDLTLQSILPQNEINLPELTIGKTINLTKFVFGYEKYLKGEFSKAIKSFKEIINNNSFSYNEKIHIYFYLGTCYLIQYKWNNSFLDEAEKYFKIVASVQKNSVESLSNLAYVYLLKNEFNKAVNLFNEVGQIIPNTSRNFNNIGLVHLFKKEYNQAKTSFLNAIRLDSSNATYYNNLGATCLEIGEYGYAIEYCFAKAIEKEPQNAMAYYNLGYAWTVLALYGVCNYDIALDFYKKALEIYPKYADAYYNIGYIYIAQGQQSEAEKYFDKALQLGLNIDKYRHKVEMNFEIPFQIDSNTTHIDTTIDIQFDTTIQLDTSVNLEFSNMH